jgi:similar to stage IV sporulation protein
MQGYLKVRLDGYAPERFLNLCSNHDILIWCLVYQNESYEFCISVAGFRRLKPILRKTKTRLHILERHGLPFFIYRYRKRKIFFGSIVLCLAALYVMSLFIWNIEISGNSYRTDSTILKFLEEKNIYHGIFKSKIDSSGLEELLRSQYEDIIWASVKIEGTRLIIDVQENLVTNNEQDVEKDNSPSDIIANKQAEIYSIITRNGTPQVEQGKQVVPGDLLVEGKLPIMNDYGEVAHYKYCRADADILGITSYKYQETFPLEYQDKVFTGKEKNSYRLELFQKRIRLPFASNNFKYFDTVDEDHPLKIGKNFYLPLSMSKIIAKEYKIEKKTYTKTEAENIAKSKLEEYCKKLIEKGVQIIENNVIIEAEGKSCSARGEIKVIETIGKRQATTKTEIPKEGQTTNESDGNNN